MPSDPQSPSETRRGYQAFMVVSRTPHHDRPLTDELFHLQAAERLAFPVSRLVVETERFRDDADEPMAAKGMGAVYISTHDGLTLKTVEDREELMRRSYDRYHAKLNAWIQRSLAEHGAALPSTATPIDRPDPLRSRSDGG